MNPLSRILNWRRDRTARPARSGMMARPTWLREAFWAGAYVLLFTLLGGLLAVSGQERTRYGVEQLAVEPIVSRVPFRAIDEEATRRKKEDARQREPAVYRANLSQRRNLTDALGRLAALTASTGFTTFEQIPEATRAELALTPEGWADLRRLVVNGQPTPAWAAAVDSFIDDYFDIAVLSLANFDQERDAAQRAPKLTLQHPNPAPPQRPAEADRYDDSLYTFAKDRPAEVDRLRATVSQKVDKAFVSSLRRSVLLVVMRNVQASYELNDKLSKLRAETAAEREPAVEISFKAGQVIVAAGKKISDIDMLLLQRENEAYASQVASVSYAYPMLMATGRVGVVAIIGLAVWAYVLAYASRIARNPMRGLALTGLLLLCQLVAVSAAAVAPRYVLAGAIGPTLLASMVLAIAYDRRFAIAIGALQTLLVLFTLELPIAFGLVMLVGIGAAAGQLDEVRTRSKVVMTGLWASIAMALAALLSGLATRSPLADPEFTRVRFDVEWALMTGIGAGLLVQALLPAIEKVFRVTTAMTLKELNDASHPLLRRLAQEAPGTYQHSLRIADMSEAAAEAIGADALLCRVGAMYHDIGKINKPQYFIENQAGGPNRHDKLPPAMSLLIIVAHVRDGAEMAREYRLPASVRQFIETHHGTTLVEYFYHAARQRHGKLDEPLPTELEYRYPGPKPQTREAAILMLCDGIEGAARMLPDPSPARFEQLVHGMAGKRLSDGQFDESALTLHDLHRIEQSIVRTLCAMYHTRIAYPAEAQRGAMATGTTGVVIVDAPGIVQPPTTSSPASPPASATGA